MSTDTPLTPVQVPPPPSPMTLLTSASAPSSPASRTARSRDDNRCYVISPHKLYDKHCSCIAPSRPLSTANDIIEYMHGRLRKVIGRLTSGGKVAPEVHDAFTRVLLELRGRGEELFHLVGWEGPSQYRIVNTRRDYNVVFMIPDPDEKSRHRVLAEIMIQYRETGRRHRGTIENVAVRYAEDWEDWTVIMDWEYLREENAPEAEKIKLREEGTMTGKQVIGEVWEASTGFIEKQSPGLKGDFIQRMGRAVERLNNDDDILTAFAVEMGYRQAVIGSKSGAAPVLRIVLYATKVESDVDIEKGLGELKIDNVLDKSSGRQKGSVHRTKDESDHSDNDHVAAVILIDLSAPGRGAVQVKHIAVIYEGEWPLMHHYRKNIPAPDLAGLEALLISEQDNKAIVGSDSL